MIQWGSRYRRKDSYTSDDPRRGREPIEGAAPHLVGDTTVRREHLVMEGDRLDLLAQRYYGDPQKYWLICDANDTVFPEDLLVLGRILQIPRNRL